MKKIGRYAIGTRVVAYSRGMILAVGPVVGGRASRSGLADAHVLIVLDDKSKQRLTVYGDEVVGERTWKRQVQSDDLGGLWRKAQAEYDRA